MFILFMFVPMALLRFVSAQHVSAVPLWPKEDVKQISLDWTYRCL